MHFNVTECLILKNELLSHVAFIRSRKLRYYGLVMRKSQDTGESVKVSRLVKGTHEGVEDKEGVGLSTSSISGLDSCESYNKLAVRDRKCWMTLTQLCSQSCNLHEVTTTR